ALGALAVVDMFGIEPNWLDVTHHDVHVAKLPASLEGYRIAQVTDAHLDDLGAVEDAIVREVRALDVRLVALTGDIVNGTRYFPELREFCRALAGRERSLVATFGNWEHWGEIQPELLARTYAAVGATLVVNDALSVDSALGIVATDDSLSGRVRLAEALEKRPKSAVKLFLTHCPELFDRMPSEAGRFDLSLAGHTHGGQGRLGPLAPFLPPGSGRFVSGWYETPGGRAYVSRGTGTSIVPARFACRPELPVFTLRRA
ncbi:MAG TPA: metallophosphoesterase, partial [Polyangiaceae bacterium]